MLNAFFLLRLWKTDSTLRVLNAARDWRQSAEQAQKLRDEFNMN